MTLVAEPLARPALAARIAAADLPTGSIGGRRLLEGLDRELTRHAVHLQVHGGLPWLSREQLLVELDASGLTGRGGAAFPVAAKLRALRQDATAVLVVNGAEGEPASAKDHVLLARAPHLVLDGAALVAAAVGAEKAVLAVTDPALVPTLRGAASSRPDGALFEVRLVAERFLAGEARALLSTLEGGTGLPPGRRVRATDRGLHGAPTLVLNAETYAQLGVLARTGAAAAGTTLLTVSGAVSNPAVLEVPLGVELGEVAQAVGAAPSQSVVVGGYHGAWLVPDPSLRLSVPDLAAAGGTLGAGVVLFVGEDTCPVAELAAVAGWLAGESAGQCGPCAFGLPAVAQDVARLVAHRPGADAALAVRHARQVTGRGACGHPDGSTRFVLSGLAVSAEDVGRHRGYGGCGRPVRGHLALSRSAAMTAPRQRSPR